MSNSNSSIASSVFSLRPIRLINSATVYVEEEINSLQDRISESVEGVSTKIETSNLDTLEKIFTIRDFKIIDRMRREKPALYQNMLAIHGDIKNQNEGLFKRNFKREPLTDLEVATLKQLFTARLGI